MGIGPSSSKTLEERSDDDNSSNASRVDEKYDTTEQSYSIKAASTPSIPVYDKKGLKKILAEKYEQHKIEAEYEKRTDLKRIESQLFNRCDGLPQFPVRLYVMKSVPKGFFGKIMSKGAQYLSEVGSAHLAIQIATSIVHWVDSSYTVITDVKGKNCVGLFYPTRKGKEEIKFIQNTEANRMRICNVIKKWNSEKTYSYTGANCQQFATDLLTSVDLDGNFKALSGEIGEYLKYVAKYSSKELKPCLVQNGVKVLEWEDHKELDDWHRDNGDGYDEYLMKGLHRAHQLRGDDGRNCPFGDPTLLFSDNTTATEKTKPAGSSVPTTGESGSATSGPNRGRPSEFN